MNKRIIAGAAAILVFVSLVIVAVAAGNDGSSGPKPLPVGAMGGTEDRAASMSMAVDGGGYAGTEYRVGDLPDLPDEADAWTLPVGTADAGRIAEILDVPRDQVHAERSGGAPWSVYLDMPVSSVASTGYACPEDQPCVPPEAETEEPERPEGLPTKDEAEKIGRTLLEQLGLDLEHATVRVEDGFSQWVLIADPEVDGVRVVGMSTVVGIGPHGDVVQANGWGSDADRGDTYPLIGLDAAVAKLKDQPRIMMDTADGAEPALGMPAPECIDCPEPEPQIVTITGAELGLQLYGAYETTGPAYLVPTYLFTTEPETGELSVIAVDDKYIAQPPTPEPVPEPRPVEPAEPGQTEPGQGPADDPNAGGGSSGGSCNGFEGDEVYVQVCGPQTARVGEALSFELVAKGRVRDDCGSPVPEWGDGEDVAVCAIGCESLPEEPRGVQRTFEHAYAKAGSYTATFTLMGCGSDGPQGSVSLEVLVQE